MRPVVRLAAKVIQTRSLPGAGVGVGYGYAFRSAGALPLATIALGYADGWPRAAAPAAFVDGVRLPFVGRVSMDSIMLDISALPPGRLKEGDMVELIGAQQSVDDGRGARRHDRLRDADRARPPRFTASTRTSAAAPLD